MGKKFLVTTATADERVEHSKCTNIYDEETLLHSDYKKFLPKKMYKTTVQIDKVIGINSTPLANKDEQIEWVTTITRIA